jgi:hypothetical protein
LKLAFPPFEAKYLRANEKKSNSLKRKRKKAKKQAIP